METAIVREQLRQFIEEADAGLLELMIALAEKYNKQGTETERKDWHKLNKKNLARFYSEDEPEYTLNMLKELNPEYRNESR